LEKSLIGGKAIAIVQMILGPSPQPMQIQMFSSEFSLEAWYESFVESFRGRHWCPNLAERIQLDLPFRKKERRRKVTR